jgi:hypothetical protein
MNTIKKFKDWFFQTFIGIYTVNWDTWEDCYDYGANRGFFLNKALCQCKHRDHSHREIARTISYHGSIEYVEKCKECACSEYKAMSNLDWLEYNHEMIPQIKAFCLRDYYDYFRAVRKGENSGIRSWPKIIIEKEKSK